MLAILIAHAIATAAAPLLVYRWGRRAFYPLALVPLGSLGWVATNWPGHQSEKTGPTNCASTGCPSCRWTSTCGSTPWPRS